VDLTRAVRRVIERQTDRIGADAGGAALDIAGPDALDAGRKRERMIAEEWRGRAQVAARPDWITVGAGICVRDRRVTWIQRLATENGLAPATGCDDAHVGAEVLTPYAADYFFYRSSSDGERIRQCAAR
jgi:hypothetical protein